MLGWWCGCDLFYCKNLVRVLRYTWTMALYGEEKGGQSVDTVVNAMNAAAEADAVLGLELHPEKLASFATRKHLQQQLIGVLAGAAVDGRVTERLGSSPPCFCGETTPAREHHTFFCSASPWRWAQKSAVERRLLLPLVRAPRNPFQYKHWSRIRSSSQNFCDNLTLGCCPCWGWMVAVS